MTATYLREGRGRSLRAEAAEDDGRLPLTRAIPVVARRAGVTQKVARAALLATHDGEWHHVGKYANACDYYDVDAACIYASPDYAAKRAEEDRLYEVEMFRQKLIRQRDCSRSVRRHDASCRWHDRCRAAGISCETPLGDVVAFRAAVDARYESERPLRELTSLLEERFLYGRDDMRRDIYVRGRVRVLIHNGGVNVYGIGDGIGCKTPSQAMELIVDRLNAKRI